MLVPIYFLKYFLGIDFLCSIDIMNDNLHLHPQIAIALFFRHFGTFKVLDICISDVWVSESEWFGAISLILIREEKLCRSAVFTKIFAFL